MSVPRIVPFHINPCFLKVVCIFFSFATWYYIICGTVANHVGYVIGINVCVCTKSGVFVWTLLRTTTTDHVILWRHIDWISARLVSTINRSGPVADSINSTALVCVFTKITFNINRLATNLYNCLSISHAHHRSQVTSGRESGNTDE